MMKVVRLVLTNQISLFQTRASDAALKFVYDIGSRPSQFVWFAIKLANYAFLSNLVIIKAGQLF